MDGPTPDVFSPAVVEAVTTHMNADHAEDSLLICRSLGGEPGATAGEMVSMDERGVAFIAEVPSRGPVPVLVPWAERPVERADIRAEVVRMYRAACVALGLEPRAEAG